MNTNLLIRHEKIGSAVLLALGITIALLVPNVAEAIKPYALPALFFVVTFSLLPYAGSNVKRLFKTDPLIGRALFWQMFLIPSALLSAGIVLGLSDAIIAICLISATAGSVFSAPVFASLLNLDNKRSLQIMMGSTVLMPVSLYFFFFIFRGPALQIQIVEYVERVVVFLVVPIVLVLLYSFISKKLSERAKAGVEHSSQRLALLSLLVFGMGIVNYVDEAFVENPAAVLFKLGIVVGLGALMMFSSFLALRFCGVGIARTAAVLSMFRNVGLSYALVGGVADHHVLVYIGVAQIPMFYAPLIAQLFFSKSKARGVDHDAERPAHDDDATVAART